MHSSVLNKLGFVHLRRVLSPQLLLDLNCILSSVFEEVKKTKFAKTQQSFWQKEPSRQIKTLRLPNVDKILSNDQTFLSVLNITTTSLEKHFDCKLNLCGVHSFFKPAKIGIETPWHQDPAYGEDSVEYSNITCWIPLRDVLSETESCLEFIPGSQVNKKLRHHSPLSKKRLSALIADVSDHETTNSITVPCKLGDMVLHKSYVLHRSTPNFSDQDRISVVFIYKQKI